MSDLLPPSGRQLELRSGGARAVVVGVGGGLRRYAVDGVDVVDGFARDAMATGGRGQHLLPWPNRVGDGRWSLDGAPQQLALSEASARNAIHGLARWAAWEVVEAGTSTALLRHVVQPQPGYPFRVEVTVAWQLSGDGLRADVTATCAGPRPAPFGYGAHPYLAVGTGLVDDAQLQVPALRRLEVDDRGLPVTEREVAGTAYDFGAVRRVGPAALDTCYGGLEREGDGTATLTLAAGGRTTQLWADASFPHLQVYTGDNLPLVQDRRRSLAVEPMTCPPDALRTGTGLVWLEPERPWSGSWGIRPA